MILISAEVQALTAFAEKVFAGIGRVRYIRNAMMAIKHIKRNKQLL